MNLYVIIFTDKNVDSYEIGLEYNSSFIKFISILFEALYKFISYANKKGLPILKTG